MRRHSAWWWVHSFTALWFFLLYRIDSKKEWLSSFYFSLVFAFRGGCSLKNTKRSEITKKLNCTRIGVHNNNHIHCGQSSMVHMQSKPANGDPNCSSRALKANHNPHHPQQRQQTIG
ncbi:MAG: hypothetical protein BYD32DRAFT_411273 [Podila humilis]|nr:MAG: hypothetical protein BYD32DRAFT_411273 [Podila humilis]